MKPDDIPQDVWGAAKESMEVWGSLPEPKTPYEAYKNFESAIARAILTERERCARVCDDAEKQCFEGRNKYPIKSEMRIINHGAMTLARDLASAIRKGGE